MKRFLIGFLITLATFALINLLSAHLASDCGLPAVFGRDACADDIVRAGWPLRFYEDGGFAYRHMFNLLFLLLNIAVGLGVSGFAGWMYSRRKSPLPK